MTCKVEMVIWSKNEMTCHICKTNYNRKTESMKGDAAAQGWFRTNVMKKPEERNSWFTRNKDTYEPHKKRSFDGAGKYEEGSVETIKAEDYDFHDWLPSDEWVIRERGRGTAGDGNPTQQRAVALESFENELKNKNYPKRKSGCGKYMLLGVYRGMRDTVGTGQERSRAWKRERTIKDNVVSYYGWAF